MLIEDWRLKIDAIDDELVTLLNRRARLVAEIVVEKRRECLTLHDPQREKDIVLRACRSNAGPMDQRAIAEIFRLIISESRRAALEVASSSGEYTGRS